jgi:hypothetical protein
MDRKKTTQRPTIFFLVLAVHLVILVLILTASRTANVKASVQAPIQLVYLEPVKAAKMFVAKNPSRFLDPRTGLSPATPVFNTSMPAGPASIHDGRGSAVNWAAEAHRAVRAFEIRRDESTSSSQSVSSSLDDTGSREHHANYSRTENGDWIVWINADCYKIASWNAGTTAFAVLSAPTICRNPATAPHED